MGDHRHSLRRRITAGATTVLVGALLVGALVAATLLRRALETEEAALLAARIDDAEQLASSGDLTPLLDTTAGVVGQLQVLDRTGSVVVATPGLTAATRLDVLAAPATGEQVSATVDGARIGGRPGDRYRVIARTVTTPTGPITVYGAISLAGADRAERFLRNGLLLGLPLVVLVAMVIVSRVVRRALAPVEAMRIEVDRIQSFELSDRVRVRDRDDELNHLAATLNRMLDRLQDDAERQRLFSAAASHELRSPLSAIRTELEVGLAYPVRTDWPAMARDVLTELDRLESLARDLRALTRPPTPVVARRSFDLAGLVRAETARRARTGPPHYRVRLGDAPVLADPDRVVQVVRNLLDNAERHARDTVEVTVDGASGRSVLVVANDGEPIPADELKRIFEPFHRLDEARSLDEGGSGLGLAIARSIMTGLGGSLEAEPVMKGARFVAAFPLTAPLP